jgi:hypothetical protein
MLRPKCGVPGVWPPNTIPRLLIVVAVVAGCGEPTAAGESSCPICGGQIWHIVDRVPRPTVAEIGRWPRTLDSG